MTPRDEVTMEWLMEGAIDAASPLSLARMTLASGALSELHQHGNCSEVLHVVSGYIRQRIGDNWSEMSAGETCLIPQDTLHQTQNLGDRPAVMMLAYSAGTREYTAS